MKKKILVTFYSKDGHAKKVGEKITNNLDADMDQIIDLKDRDRKIIGWLIAGKDAGTKNLTQIKHRADPSKYDLVIIGTPVWAWTVTPAIRTYLSENKLNKVAFFCTCGGQPGKTFAEMESLSKKPIDVLMIEDKELDHSDEAILKFCQGLK